MTILQTLTSQVWAEVTDLNFVHRKYGPVHIDVKFADGEHGDGDPFDGIGGTLAHAFFPVYGGGLVQNIIHDQHFKYFSQEMLILTTERNGR